MYNKNEIKITFTPDDITRGIKILESNLAVLSILMEILKPYYSQEYTIKNAHSLAWILNHLTLHLFGQTSRCWFDRANKNYKTISIYELFLQMKNHTDHKNYSEFKKNCNHLENTITRIAKDYKSLVTLTDSNRLRMYISCYPWSFE